MSLSISELIEFSVTFFQPEDFSGLRDGDVFRSSNEARLSGSKMWAREKEARDRGWEIKYRDPEVYFDGLTIPVFSQKILTFLTENKSGFLARGPPRDNQRRKDARPEPGLSRFQVWPAHNCRIQGRGQ